MPTGRGLVRNSFLILITNLVTRVSSAALFLIVARTRQPTVAGVFTLATSYALLLEAVSQLGLDQLLIRDIARDRSRTELIFNGLLTMRLVLLATTIAVFASTLSIGQLYDGQTRLILVLMALVPLPDITVDMCQALFVVTDRLTFPTVISVVIGIVRVASGFVVLRLNGTLMHLALAMLFASLAQTVLNVGLVARHKIRVRLTLAKLHWRSTLAQALPFGVVQVLVAIEAYVGTVLLSGAVSEAVLGYYGAANSLLAAMLLIPNAIQVAIFPRMTEVYVALQPNLAHFYARIYRYLAILGGAMIIAVVLMAEWLTLLLYQGAYRPSAALLQILSGTLFISFLNIPNVRAMIIVGQQRRMAEMLSISVTLNVVLTILLIPVMNVLAVPIARVISMACFFGMNHLYVRRHIVEASLPQILWRPLVGLGVGFGLALAANEQSVWLQLCISLTCYFVTIVVLGGLPREERQYLKSVFLNRRAAHESSPN